MYSVQKDKMPRKTKHRTTYKIQYFAAAAAFVTGTILYIMARNYNNSIKQQKEPQEYKRYVPTTVVPTYKPKHNVQNIHILPKHAAALKERATEELKRLPVSTKDENTHVVTSHTETNEHVPVFSDTGDKRMSIIAAVDTLTSGGR